MAEDINTMFFVFNSPMSLPGRVKICLTSVDPLLPKFCPKVPTPLWSEHWRYSMANCGTNSNLHR